MHAYYMYIAIQMAAQQTHPEVRLLNRQRLLKRARSARFDGPVNESSDESGSRLLLI